MLLKEYLVKNNLSVRKFAIKCRLSNDAIYDIINGKRCTLKTANRIFKKTNGEVNITNIYRATKTH